MLFSHILSMYFGKVDINIGTLLFVKLNTVFKFHHFPINTAVWFGDLIWGIHSIKLPSLKNHLLDLKGLGH